jgi:hypothetical protein
MEAYYTQQNNEITKISQNIFNSKFLIHKNICLTLESLEITIETEKAVGKSVERQSSYTLSPKSICNKTLENSKDLLLAPELK